MTPTGRSTPEALGDLFFYREAIAAGMPKDQLYHLRDRGDLISLGGGLYRRADAPPANLDWIELAERAPKATLCLETALAQHDLLDTIPTRTDVAIPRGAARPTFKAAHRLHTFDPTTFDVGRELIEVGARRTLGLYSAERSLIDMVRLRHDQGAEQAWEALRRWLDRPGRNPAQLISMASGFKGAEAPLRAALEVLL